MKTAEEVAEEILNKHYYGQTYWPELKAQIISQLTTFSEERVEQAMDNDEIVHFQLRKARADALEEAAKICDTSRLECGEFWVPSPSEIAKKIRSLKTNEQKIK